MKPETIIKIPPIETKLNKQKREQNLVFVTILLILVAWIAGYIFLDSDVLEYAYEVIPNSKSVEQQGSIFVGYGEIEDQPVGYAAIGEAIGYGGPLKVMIGLDLDGNVLGVNVIENKETPGFYRLVEKFNFLEQFTIKDVYSPFRFGDDIDGISGATISTEAITKAARAAVSQIAVDGLNVTRPAENTPIKIGMPEIVLLLLFLFAFIATKQKDRNLKKRMRWGTLIAGMVFLGFVYTAPLTISQIISLLSGYWPDWQNNLYWYFLIGGIVFVTTVDNKNPYCYWFCPFGAFQEVVGSITGAKTARPKDWKTFLTWMPRVLALTAILLGLVFRQPGVVGYEPFATLFDLRGTAFEWVFLIMTVLASLIVYRPFCHFICPIDPVVDFIAAVRRLIKKVRRRWKKEISAD